MRTRGFEGMFHACARVGIATLALLLCLMGLLAPRARAETDGTLRVKLARLGSPSVIQFRADCDYTLRASPEARLPAGTEITLSAEGDSLTLSAGDLSADLGAAARLTREGSGHSGAQFLSPALSNRFCGDLTFTASSGVITTVLEIYVEDYLYGAVGYAMSPSNDLEALKAQAVVARNYALRQKAARAASGYDLSDSGDALSFRGYSAAHEYANVVKAVDATRGQALYYGDSPATCYWCDSNGGQTESSANALGEPLPYSQVRDDPYDFEGSGAKKTAVLRKDCADLPDGLESALISGVAEQLARQGLTVEPGGVRLDAIEDIAPGTARFDAPSRLYASLDFRLRVTARTPDGEAESGLALVSVPTYGALEDWCDLSVNDADNETIWLSEKDRAFEITFRRSGSGLGMSQRGAQTMARKGLSCWDILDYYYPGVSLRQLALSGSDRTEQAAPAVAPIATARLSQKARLYEQPDDSVAALTTLPAGANVDVYAVQGEWAALGSGGIYGFAHTDVLASFALVGVSAAQVREETFAQVSAGDVDVLQLPVSGAKALATLSDGATVRLNAYSDAWARIATQDGTEGFIPRDALTLRADGAQDDGEVVTVDGEMAALLTEDAALYVNADDSVAPRRLFEKGEYVRVLAYNRAWAYVRADDGETGYVMLRALSALQAQPEQTAAGGGPVTRVEGEVYRVVSADALPLYEKNDADSAVLAIFEKGKRVQLGAYDDAWACVRADGLTGFVALSGLAEEKDPEANPEAEAVDGGEITRVEDELFAMVKYEGTLLYADWNTDSEALAALGKGERVQIGAYNARWACVRAQGAVGFVEIKNLQKEP